MFLKISKVLINSSYTKAELLLTLPSIIALCFLIVYFLTFLLNPIRPTMPEVQGKWWRVRADGVLGLAKTNFYFEEREFDRKLANGHAEQLFWKSVA